MASIGAELHAQNRIKNSYFEQRSENFVTLSKLEASIDLSP